MIHSMRMHRSVTWLLILTFLFTIGAGAFMPQPAEAADPLSTYQQRQADIQKQLNAKKSELQKADSTLKEYKSQLALVDYNISAVEEQLEAVEQQLAVAQQQLDAINKEYEEAQNDLSVQLDAFGNRLRQSYMNGEVSMLDVLFASTSMEDFITRSYYMEELLQYDAEMVDVINEKIAVVEAKKLEQESKTDTLNSLKTAKEAAIADLNSKRAEKTALVADAADVQEEAQDAYDEMLATSKEIESEIQRLIAAQSSSGSSGGGGTGIYAWPLPSGYRTITSQYGMRWHPTKHVYKMHTGIDISAPGGTSIYAADSGTVILARYYGSYGNCVIIDHGNNITTLYAHMSSIGTSVGASVSRGQTIGRVGTTGASTGNHLHFEVRRNGSHVSPWNYVS